MALFFALFWGKFRRPVQTMNVSYGCMHQARFLCPACLAFLDCLVSGSGGEAGAIDCGTRAGCEEQLPGKRPP